MKHILVGVDGSDAAAAALAWAGRLGRLLDGEVVVATAFRPDQAEVSPERYEELRSESRAPPGRRVVRAAIWHRRTPPAAARDRHGVRRSGHSAYLARFLRPASSPLTFHPAREGRSGASDA
jgi:nucleotide-binding universal stress UspA family protein